MIMNHRPHQLIFFVGAFLISLAATFAAHAGSNAQLIEGAKREGALSYYTTMTLSQSKKVIDKFQQKYPFI
jgi:hypothetical protein